MLLQVRGSVDVESHGLVQQTLGAVQVRKALGDNSCADIEGLATAARMLRAHAPAAREHRRNRRQGSGAINPGAHRPR